MDKEFTLVIIKPDAIQKCLVKTLEHRLNQEGLKVVKQKTILIDLNFIQKLYQWQVIFYPTELEEYLCTIPLPVWLIEGDNAVEKALRVKAEIRREFGTDELHTLLHCPDSKSDFEREYALIFSNETPKGRLTMKTNNQVEVYLFQRSDDKGILFLILKRIPEKGGFWQPITGNVQEEESFEEAALREIREETGISTPLRLINTGYSFDFFDDNRWQHEHVFGAQVEEDTEITLSHEHTDFKWVTKEEALNKYLKWPGNKEGLKKLSEILEGGKK
ncbi:MAG: NUDIX domain-containing protein [Minisyncoccales bacterium]